MTSIKIKEIVRCSSEDSLNPARNLLKSGKKWLSSRTQQDDKIVVEFQFQKADVISYFDIGNHGSHTITVLVGHSMRTDEGFVCLLPAFTMMSVGESKQGINKIKVQMFKKDDFMATVRDKSWDLVQIICSQPYRKNGQFGLSFVDFKTITSLTSPTSKTKMCGGEQENQSTLKGLFAAMGESPSQRPFSSQNSTSKQNNFVTPSKKASNGVSSLHKAGGTPKMSEAAKLQFEEEVECFLIDIRIDELLEDKKVIVADLRKTLEDQRGYDLNKLQKKLFVQIIGHKFNAHKRKRVEERLSLSNDVSESNSEEIVNRDRDDERTCPNCTICLPSSIFDIHTSVCKLRKNRNDLCLDRAESSNDLKKVHRKDSDTNSTDSDDLSFLKSPRSSIWNRNRKFSPGSNQTNNRIHMNDKVDNDLIDTTPPSSTPKLNRQKLEKCTPNGTKSQKSDNSANESDIESDFLMDTTPPTVENKNKPKSFKIMKTPSNAKKIEKLKKLLDKDSSSSSSNSLKSPNLNTDETKITSPDTTVNGGNAFKFGNLHKPLVTEDNNNNTSVVGKNWVAKDKIPLSSPLGVTSVSNSFSSQHSSRPRLTSGSFSIGSNRGRVRSKLSGSFSASCRKRKSSTDIDELEIVTDTSTIFPKKAASVPKSIDKLPTTSVPKINNNVSPSSLQQNLVDLKKKLDGIKTVHILPKPAKKVTKKIVILNNNSNIQQHTKNKLVEVINNNKSLKPISVRIPAPSTPSSGFNSTIDKAKQTLQSIRKQVPSTPSGLSNSNTPRTKNKVIEIHNNKSLNSISVRIPVHSTPSPVRKLVPSKPLSGLSNVGFNATNDNPKQKLSSYSEPTISSTMACPICFEQIPKYEIGLHASLCDGPKKSTSSSTTDHDSIISNNKLEFVECPVCSSFVEKDLIDIHVNHCLDGS